MGLFGKISIIIWLVILGALAIMFNWFGSQDLAKSGLDKSQVAVEKLTETGDQMKEAYEIVKEKGEGAKDSLKEAVE